MSKLISEWDVPNIQICYGQTEVSPIIFQTNQNDSLQDKCTTVGTIFPHSEVKIINKKGHIVPVGESGEICIRGFGVMEKYWGDRKATSKTIDQDQWLKTGDMGVLDERGYMKIVGRLKEMIIRGGENIYPKEIEEYLRSHKSIQDVQVLGVPDEKFGEETFALIKLKQDCILEGKDIFEFCKGQIAHYKVPKYAKFVDEFPLTVTGKPQKFKMLDELKKELILNPKAFDQYKIRTY